MSIGKIHVGTISYKDGKKIHPYKKRGFEYVEIMTKSVRKWWG